MSQPTATEVHVSAPLTNLSTAFIQDDAAFVSPKIFPIVQSQKMANIYYKYRKGDWYRTAAQVRADGTESAGSGFKIEQGTFTTVVQSVHQDVGEQVRANADEPLDPERDAMRFVTRAALLRRELDFQFKYFKTGVWKGGTGGTDVVPGTKWDVSTSNPIKDISDQQDEVESKTGYRPNVLLVTPRVHSALRNNANIVDRIKYVGIGKPTNQILADLFEVETYVVARAVKNDAKEGQADDMKHIFGTDDALLAYAAPAPGTMTASAGYIFTWTGLLGAGAFGNRIKRIEMPWLGNVIRIEADLAYDMAVIMDEAAAFFTDVLT